jgi:surface protein
MTGKELNTYINRVLGNSIRCLLPAFWWKRLLTRIVEYVETTTTEVKENAESQIKNLTDKVDGIDLSDYATKDELGSLEQILAGVKSWFGIIITTGNNGSATVMADEYRVEISRGSTKKVHFLTQFKTITGVTIESANAIFANTSNVTDMSEMFVNWNVPSLDLSSFDTFNVTNMSDMFKGISATSLNLSSFDTTNVDNMDRIFLYCHRIEELTLGNGFFKTQHITRISFGDLAKWEEPSFIQSVVTNSYDRTANGLSTLELLIRNNVYAYLTDEHKAMLTAKGYIITPVSQDPDNME